MMWAVRDLTVDGLTAMQIGRQLGLSIGHVYKLRAKARKQTGGLAVCWPPRR